MARSTVVTRARKSHTAQSAPRPRRASQRAKAVELELGYPGKLRQLMIEHSRTEEGGWITVYAGVRGEFLSAGVPAELIPDEGSRKFEIRCGATHESELRAVLCVTGADQLELEIDWGERMPYSYGHPAICELARMMLIDFSYWTKPASFRESPDLEDPIRRLIACEDARDFKPGQGAGKLTISAEFHTRLRHIGQHIYHEVHRYGEVFPAPTAAKKPESKNPIRLVIDNSRDVSP